LHNFKIPLQWLDLSYNFKIFGKGLARRRVLRSKTAVSESL